MIRNFWIIILFFVPLGGMGQIAVNDQPTVELKVAVSQISSTFIVVAMERINGKKRAALYRSTDQGNSFELIDSILPNNGISIADPVLTVDQEGSYYLALMHTESVKPLIAAIHIYKSTDDGMTWKLQSIPHESSLGTFPDYPQIDVDQNNNILLTYAVYDQSNHTEIKGIMACSNDHGLTWTYQTTPFKRAAGLNFKIDQEGRAHVFVGIKGDTVAYAATSDYGANWTEPVYLVINENEKSHMTKPVHGSFENRLGFISHQPHQLSSGLFYHFRDEENNWQSTFFGRGAYAEAIWDRNGVLHIFYHEKKRRKFRLNYIKSENQGKSFTKPQTIYKAKFENSQFGEYQSLLLSPDNQFYLFFSDWSDNSKAKLLKIDPTSIQK